MNIHLFQTKGIQPNLKNKSKIISTPTSATSGDTSGDETSSHGTLESFIPPPSNFEGQNNPFLNLDSLSYGMPVIRPLKRKLNESDIRIDKNGEVKRRRYRRKYDREKLMSLIQPGNNVNNNTNVNGNNFRLNGSGNIKNCVDYALSARLVKDDLTEVACSTENKMGDGGSLSFNDLKSTVCSYFGAPYRIANGEKFHVLAKRCSTDNKVQYLIEWDSPVSS